jgi:hypothetical protein
MKVADVAAFIHHLMRLSLTMVLLGHPGVYTCRVMGSVKAISVKYEIMKRKIGHKSAVTGCGLKFS